MEKRIPFNMFPWQSSVATATIDKTDCLYLNFFNEQWY